MNDHRPICALCEEPWPCEHMRIERQVARFRQQMDSMCPGCGEVVRQGQAYVVGPEGIFHIARSKPRCLNAAKRAYPDTLDTLAAATGDGRLRSKL